MRLRLLVLPVLLAVCACSTMRSPLRIPPPSTSSPAMTAQPPDPMPINPPIHTIDPVARGLTAKGVTALCDEHLARARQLLESIRGLEKAGDQALTWESVLGRVDEISLELSVGAGFPSLMAVGHPDKEVREAAKLCEPKVDQFRTEMMLDARFAGVVKRYAQRFDTPTTSDQRERSPLAGTGPAGARARLLRELLRDLRRNGLDLPPDSQAKLRSINEKLSKLQQDFVSNIADAVQSITVKPEQLKGVPPSFLEQRPPGPDGLVTVSTNYPDYFPIVTFAEDRSIAKALTAKFDNRAADKNLEILDEVLRLRHQKAKLLGYETWADYAIEPRMARTAKNVQGFLDDLGSLLEAPARKEYKAFRAELRRLGARSPKRIATYDRAYIEQKLRNRRFGFDARELSEYFAVESVTRGLLELVQELYGLSFRPNESAPRWHSDVQVLDVMESGAKLGTVYLDLYPREGKYKHAAMFEIRTGKRLGDGSYLPPMAALVCNFSKPGKGPALMTHNEVTTFFHEFGHTLHHVLTQQDLATYAGTNTTRDFVEVPSQVFEEWAFRRDTLDRFARHHRTGKAIPDKLFRAMTQSRSFGRALQTQRQLSLAVVDFVFHTKKPPFDTDSVFQEVMDKTQLFSYLPDTHFQANFGHLMGYDAGYYGYQWALAIARDVLTRFESEGFMNPGTAARWRRTVLEPGGGEDEATLIEGFLGRSHNLEAYRRFLAGK